MAPQPERTDAYIVATREEADRLQADAKRLREQASVLMERAQQASALAFAAEQRVLELDEILGRAPQLRLVDLSRG
jgi:hypothetical protein